MSEDRDIWFESLVAACARDVPLRERLSEVDLWQTNGGPLWRAERFVGEPSFYPVFRWQDYYSYSPLPLILRKGGLSPNPAVIEMADDPDFIYAATEQTIDREVIRLGGPLSGSGSIKTAEEFGRRMVAAQIADIHATEAANPGTKNLVLCGGKDSLNLLLLPWQHETIAISAAPNHELVAEFVKRNGLDIEVRLLEDPADERFFEREVLANACDMDILHARWGVHLARIAEELDHQLIFWKGQTADVYTTPRWVVLTHPMKTRSTLARKVYLRAARVIPGALRHGLERRLLEPGFRRAMWVRCAMFQGSHMSMIRLVTGALTLSGYHGPAMTEVFREIDLARVADRDMRSDVGELLLGRPVEYPTQNPGPPVTMARQGLCRPERFLTELRRRGVAINAG